MGQIPLTLGMVHSILAGMSHEEQTDSVERDLKGLEVRLEALIRTVTRLKEENTALRARQEDLIAERASLIDKTEQAKSRVESMITRLKSMEINL